MRRKYATIAALIVTSLSFGSTGFSQVNRTEKEVNPEFAITSDMVTADKRLNQAVTVSRSRIQIGDLFLELSALTGVRIISSERDNAGDPTLGVHCNQLPLYKLLNAVWSLVSYRKAQWAWTCSSLGGRAVYLLARPPAAARLAAELNAWIQQHFEQNAQKLLAACDASEEAKRATLKEIYGNEDIGNLTLTPKHLWADILAFKNLLTQDQRTNVLRGMAEVEAPISSLDANSRSELIKSWHQVTDSTGGIRFQNGVRVPIEPLKEPEAVQFRRVKYRNTPALIVDMVAEERGSPYEIGGVPLERAYRAYIRSLWKLDSDAETDPALKTTMMQPPPGSGVSPRTLPPLTLTEPAPTAVQTQMDQLVLHLYQVAVGAKIPLVARLPEDEPTTTNLGVPWGDSLGTYWEQLWNKALMVKWHDGVQLVSTDSWPVQDPPIPVALARELRRQGGPGGLISLELLAQMANMLTPTQLTRVLGDDQALGIVLRLKPLLALLGSKPEWLREACTSGLRFTPELVDAIRQIIPVEHYRLLERNHVQSLVISVTEGGPEPPRSLDILFQFRDPGGKMLPGFGFKQVIHARKTTSGQ